MRAEDCQCLVHGEISTNPSTGLHPLGASREVVPTLRSFSLNPNPLIRTAGLHPTLFDDGTNVVALTALARLYTLCVVRSRGPQCEEAYRPLARQASHRHRRSPEGVVAAPR
ncbi:hypothetical protein ILT44_13555 [Microvirga sp. BT689]|uniref:hypothetical protein n=1 Tax=Microvirga arvi TaxID=2778731 RepID=UPI00194F333B|nr:hypothetical protein [Microvirga arvi]MBM6581216.1 hypothetical protein [Microvirga arvi]